MSQSQDQTARRAAELLRDQLARDIREAIHQACRESHAIQGPPPTVEQVRRHVDAMAMASQGWASWQDDRRARLQEVEQFLSSMEYFLDPLELRVAGRAAQGSLDAGDCVHIRAWTDCDLDDAAVVLENAGLGTPEIGSRSVQRSVANGLARLGTMVFAGDSITFQVSLCPVRELVTLERNLVTGAPIDLASLGRIRTIIEEMDSSSDHTG
ncbi:MAG: hypothetical protein VX527_04675 [Planctomycetota bacterium]|nr:hypothetical protein [Planctomycetota bacterium]